MPSTDIKFLSVKLLCIISISIIYFIVLAVGSFALSKLFPADNKESIERTFLMFMGQIAGFVVFFYFARAYLKHIPSVFDDIAGFNHEMLKEKDGQIISGLALLMFSDSLL